MPEDKDFKRIVRARMAQTGERYTQARGALRPPTAAAASSPAERPGRPAFPARLVRLELEEFLAERAANRPPSSEAAGTSTFGPRWELTVQVGGAVDVLRPAAVSVADVAALAGELGGVGFVAFGTHFVVPAPEGTVADGRSMPPGQFERFDAMRRAAAELDHRLDQDFGIHLPAGYDRRVLRGHSSARPIERDGALVIPCRTRTVVYLGAGLDAVLGDRLDPASWLEASGDALPGTPWVGYGVVVAVEGTFETIQVPTRADASTKVSRPLVGSAFWDAAGAAMLGAAALLGLPQWPLQEATLRDPITGIQMVRPWDPIWPLAVS